MTTQQAQTTIRRKPELRGQTVVLIGGNAGVGLEAARLASAAGADIILTDRATAHLADPTDPSASVMTESVDPTDEAALDRFFRLLDRPIDHVVVTLGGPYVAPLTDFDFIRAQRYVEEQLWLPLHVARAAVGTVRPGGTLLFIGGCGARRSGVEVSLMSALTAARRDLIATLAAEVAPVRVNLIGAAYVNRPLSARLLGETLKQHRAVSGATLPIAHVVRPSDVAALAVHVMADCALTGATYDFDCEDQGGMTQASMTRSLRAPR
jgi:NAD(P)-dependent dehydrogenase (short-subunit alcohol dehydrogenase family)